MTSKEDIIPGARVVVTNQGTNFNGPVCLMPGPGAAFDGEYPKLGETLEVLTKPKKSRDGINCLRVRYKEKEMWAFYCHIRYSTRLL